MSRPSGQDDDAAHRSAQLEAILNSAVDAIITIDESGIVQSVNPATKRMFGYSPREIVGKNVEMLMPQPFRREHGAYIDHYLSTGEAKIIGIGREVIGLRADGSTFPIELAVSEAHFDGQRVFTGIVRDLTQRREAQQAEASLGRIIEDSLNEIFVFSAETWKFLLVNRGARENLGYSMDELRELTPVDIKPQMDEREFAERVDPLVSDQTLQVQFETVHQRKDGSTYAVEVRMHASTYQGTPVIVAMVLDITERVRVEKLLRVQERAIEAAGSGILITDPNMTDNPIVICNPAFLEMIGYTKEEVIGLNCRFLQRDDRDQPPIDELREAIAAGDECRVLVRNYRKDGTMFWNDLRVAPVHDADGHVTHFVGVVADVTERERRQDALRETILEKSKQLRVAESELIKQARLATLGQVFGGIAHEIRNPLNALRTSAYYLLHAQRITPEKSEEHLHRIDRQVTVIDNIVTALADVARLPQPTLDPVALQDWVPSAVAEVSLPPSITLVTELSPDLPQVLVDVNQVPIALKNLVRNARDAIPSEGTITISAKAVTEAGCVDLMVRDNGEGIAEELLTKIMEPLFSTKSNGMGLGLAITRAIVEKNNGKISVESRRGQGTTFTIRFQAKQNEPEK